MAMVGAMINHVRLPFQKSVASVVTPIAKSALDVVTRQFEEF